MPRHQDLHCISSMATTTVVRSCSNHPSATWRWSTWISNGILVLRRSPLIHPHLITKVRAKAITAAFGRVVVVLFYGDKRHYGIVVETSLDRRTWETAGDLRENKELSTQAGMTCRFEPRPVRFIRVRVPHNSANTGRHLVEVMAFEQ